MASPQKENGFTGVANEILENVQMFKFSLNELKIIMCVWRFTYGFSRKEHEMSLSFFMKHTGLNRSRVNDSIKKLISYKVIQETRKGNANRSNCYAFNKNYEQWGIEKYASFTSAQVDTSVQVDTSIKPDTSTSVQDDTSTSVQFDTQERKIKEILNKEEEEEKNPILIYERNFGIITPIQMERIWKWVDDFDNQEIVCMAIKETALKNPRTPFSYFGKILEDWHRRKLFSVEEILREKQKHEKALEEKKLVRTGKAKVSKEDFNLDD